MKSRAQDVQEILTTFGDTVRGLRLQAELTQKQLADLVGMSLSHLAVIENGGTNLGIVGVVRLAEVLNVNPATLLRKLADTPEDNSPLGNLSRSLDRLVRNLSRFRDDATLTFLEVQNTLTAMQSSEEGDAVLDDAHERAAGTDFRRVAAPAKRASPGPRAERRTRKKPPGDAH